MRSYRLTARILLSLSALVVLTAALVGGIIFVSWTVGGLVASALFAPVSWGRYAGATVGCATCAGLFFLQFRSGAVAISDFLGAVPPSETTYSDRDLTDLVGRVALQFDLPAPTVRIAETSVPHASVSGFTRQRATLVVSTGLLDRLGDEELRAVVAHEMAHVSNRDAAVVSLVALPAVFGRSILNGLNGGKDKPSLPNNSDGFTMLVFLVGGLIWLVGQSLLAVFARQRELAADSAAVELTGNPTTLATALRKADIETVDAPTTDLRKTNAVSVFSIVEPPKESVQDEFSIWVDGKRPHSLRIRDRIVTVGERLFRTHPSTEQRCERLRSDS